LAHRSNTAIVAFAAGRSAFKRNDIRMAERLFRDALREDPSFGIAAWWLANVWRWQLTGAPTEEVDFVELLETHGPSLPERVRQLIAAQLAQTQDRRYEIYREVIDNDPRDAYAAVIYAEELHNRGAFAGIPVEFTERALEEAVRKDASFGPLLGSLVRSYIRTDNQSGAARYLEWYAAQYPADAVPEGEFDEYDPRLLQWMFAERFGSPDDIEGVRDERLAQPGMLSAMPFASRLASALSLPATQVDVASAALGITAPDDSGSRAGLHESLALGLMALGRTREAFNHFDSAAALFNTALAALEAQEWRIVANTVGLPRDADRDMRLNRGVLERLVGDSAVGLQAAWALGLDAVNAGDMERTRTYLDMLEANRPDTIAERLGSLLSAVELASTGRYRQALEQSQALLASDSAARGGDPFARAVLHLKRAEWFDSLGRHEAADSMRLWYEHFEVIRLFEGEAQAAEIDWALSTYAMWVRGMAAADRSDRPSACFRLPRVLELWTNADAPFASLEDRTQTVVRRMGCR